MIRGEASESDLGDEIVDAVDGQVDRSEAAGQEAPPPPVVVLNGAEV